MAINLAGYKKMLGNMLPVGPLFRYLNTALSDLLEAFAVELNRIDTSADTLRREANPSTATVSLLLPEWEEMVLLADEKPTGSETEAQRQQVVAAKIFTAYNGPSLQFFIDLAARLGLDVTISEGSGSFTVSARCGVARCGTARTNIANGIYQWNIHVNSDPDGNLAKFQLLVARFKPAHTEVSYI